jgi:hypothetical protein
MCGTVTTVSAMVPVCHGISRQAEKNDLDGYNCFEQFDIEHTTHLL